MWFGRYVIVCTVKSRFGRRLFFLAPLRHSVTPLPKGEEICPSRRTLVHFSIIFFLSSDSTEQGIFPPLLGEVSRSDGEGHLFLFKGVWLSCINFVACLTQNSIIMDIEKKAALADILLEQMATISALREENAHLRSELEALEALNNPQPYNDDM